MLESIIIVLTLGLDQLVKYWAQTSLLVQTEGSIPVIQDVFHVIYVKNYGAAFGILQNQRPLFIILTIVVLCIILYILFFKRKGISLWLRIALAFMTSGVLGNFIDRLVFGYVRDMFDFRLINFAIFNVADACISIAAVLMIISILLIDGKKGLNEKECLK